MADIIVSILSASGARGGPVLFNSSDRLSHGEVYEALQNFQGEMGYLVTVSGAGVERGCMGLMKPGKYTFITTGRRAKGEPPQTLCAWFGQNVRKLRSH